MEQPQRIAFRWPLAAARRRAAAWLREYGHHLAFGLLIVSLAALAAWWAVFIHRSIRVDLARSVEMLRLEARLLAARLSLESGRPLPAGALAVDPRFEIVSAARADPAGIRFAIDLAPAHPGRWLQARPGEWSAIERRYRRRRLMIAGEGATAVLLVLGCSLLLYAYVRAERRAAREVSNFWQHLTHWVKTPITGLKFFLQGLRDGTIPENERADLSALALLRVEGQERLAENLLAGSRWLGARDRPRFETVALGEFVDAYLDRHPLLLGRGRARREGETGLNVVADRHLLRLVLDNLVDNALKYGPAPAELRLRIERGRRRHGLVVSDGGPPFSRRHARRMMAAFRFAAAELPVGRRGSGMGLYLARRLARQMGGELRALDAREACRASLRLTLPRA